MGKKETSFKDKYKYVHNKINFFFCFVFFKEIVPNTHMYI